LGLKLAPRLQSADQSGPVHSSALNRLLRLWLFEYTTPCLRSTDLMQLAQLRMARFAEDNVTISGGNQAVGLGLLYLSHPKLAVRVGTSRSRQNRTFRGSLGKLGIRPQTP
jgi:hypothetical protein